MPQSTDVAIIGAGPYGLSLAAFLAAAGIDFRIFGRPMDAWKNHMPQGMLLKSDGFASNLCNPDDSYPLSRFCEEQAIPYDDERVPVSLSNFVDYGLAFKNRFVPGLEEKMVEFLNRENDGFALRFDDGSKILARCVVLAVGLHYFRFLPPILATLPAEYVSHSYDHSDLASMAGRRVAVVGAGASAIDLASLLIARGCEVQMVCRQKSLKFGGAPGPGKRSLWQRVRHPRSGLGPGLRSRLCTDAPLLFHFLPEAWRREIVRRHLGPFASWRMKEAAAQVPVLADHSVVGAVVKDHGVELLLQTPDNRRVTTSVDQVVAATGYRVDIRQLEFLDSDLMARIRSAHGAPVLSTRFESSINGLFFIGIAAASSFGPLMRFAFGARFVSRRLAPALARRLRGGSGQPVRYVMKSGTQTTLSP
jgi:hypothetical protein